MRRELKIHEKSKGKVNSYNKILKALKRDKYLFLIFLPIFIWYAVFMYLPMGGLVIAFKDFKPGAGLYGGDWVGLKWFIQFFQSPYAFRLIRNTLLISVYSILYGFPLPIIFAVCICEIRSSKLRKSIQTVSYLPHFISTVVLVGIIKEFLAVDTGIVNNFLGKLGIEPINFLMKKDWFKTIYVSSGVWQSFGFNSIIYIAAIVGIDPSLYESAKIDGISKFKEVWYITIPMIAPTIIILFILRLGTIMSVGFEKVFLLYNPGIYETADVISTYVYRKGIESTSFSFSAAVGLFNSIINFILIFGSNVISRRVTQTSLW
ncbi:MAG TPA: sugar ABC transporter permease [Clostridiales bacterium]|nr:ABC transporter permease subunit [Clostridia bacterium]HCS75860.1 sugar ABC transporter permease [Clostridiales bacterium]